MHSPCESLPSGIAPPIALGGKSRCEIAEVLVYDRALSEAELTRLWKYFSAKYRITTPAVSIPGSPPRGISRKPPTRLPRDPSSRTGDPSNSTNVPSGSATRSSASGPTGARSASRNKATGMAYHMYHPGQPSVPVPRRALRPSLEVRLQGRLQRVEGRPMGPGEADPALQACRGQVFRRPGEPSRQFRQLELEVPAVELGQRWAEEGPHRQLGEGGPRTTACVSA